MNAGGSAVSGQPQQARRETYPPSAVAGEHRAAGRGHYPEPGASRVRPRRPRGALRGPHPAPWVRRRRRWRLTTGLAAALVLVCLVLWALLGSALFGIRAVQVIGNKGLAAEDVRAVAAVPLGAPILRLDVAGVEARVAALPRVAAVRVSRTLSGTVHIEVTERIPVAMWRAPHGIHLVEASGIDFATVPVPPPGLPELRVARVGPDDAVAIAALTVLTGLPDPLRAQVLWVGAESPADIKLLLSDGREVHWGGVEAGGLKAAVLAPLLTQPGKVYDISSPDLPTIS